MLSVGYEPIFVDRQMIIQILYDNLRDKSKVLTSKGVSTVEHTAGGVEVTTGDGEKILGDILIGADGIHSTVRREMWRLADEDTPGYFPVSERTDAPTEYCCIFGISRPTDGFPKYTSQNVVGQDYSYLVATGPNHRIYWFLFKKLRKYSQRALREDSALHRGPKGRTGCGACIRSDHGHTHLWRSVCKAHHSHSPGPPRNRIQEVALQANHDHRRRGPQGKPSPQNLCNTS